jgi:hypothetical protein
MADSKKIVRTIFIVYVAIVSLIGLIMTTSADIPSYLENCNDPYSRGYYPEKVITEDSPTEEELLKQCEARRAQNMENYAQEKARDAVRNFALIIVGIPLFLVHFRLFLKERRELDGKETKK